jgi:hypothetical protein
VDENRIRLGSDITDGVGDDCWTEDDDLITAVEDVTEDVDPAVVDLILLEGAANRRLVVL